MSTENFIEEASQARHCLKVADHMLNVTFPLVKDPKLLLAVVENLYLSMEHTIAAFLYYERFYKRIPPFHRTTDSMLTTFAMRSVPEHKLPTRYISLFQELGSILEAHKSSSVEFSRKEKLVMATDQFSLKTLQADTMKDTLKSVKNFVQDILGRVEKG